MDLFLNFIIVTSSIALLCYWFRYICWLILAAEPTLDDVDAVAGANRLEFPEIRSRLRGSNTADFRQLHQLLNRDFAIIHCLLDHVPLDSPDAATERTLLKIHFRVMSAWFRLSCSKFPDLAGGTLDEMCRVVTHLAGAMGPPTLTRAAY